MKALHIGAGKIGRGFIGAQLIKSGIETTFADVNTELVNALNSQKQYTLHIMERDGYEEKITNFSAVEIDSPLFYEHFAQADVVTTAVSMGVLEKLAPIIATALCKRHTSGCDSPLNIICCENGVRATTQLKNFVFQHLDTQSANWCSRTVGFADCSVDRIVPIATFDNPLDVGVERYCEWNIDSGQIVGALPNIVGVHFTDNLEALVERKLYTLNTAHCATAYLGAQKGYKFIHEAVTDPDIRQLVEQIMEQSSAALCAKFGIDSHLQQHYAQSVLHRFENPLLADTVSRVARDPMRKLSPKLYFAYPALMALKYTLPTDALATAVAAALYYRSDNDFESKQLAVLIEKHGISQTIKSITGITNTTFVECVERKYREF